MLPCSKYVFDNPVDVGSPHDLGWLVVHGQIIKINKLVFSVNLELLVGCFKCIYFSILH